MGTDRERYQEALLGLKEDPINFDKDVFEAIFKSMTKSKDSYVRKKCEYLAYYIQRYLPEHLKVWVIEQLTSPEFGMKFESEGKPETKTFKSGDFGKMTHLTAAKIHMGKLKAKGIESKMIESEDKVIVKWMEPKKEG